MTLVKLCGNRTEQDMALSAASDATHLGFIFVEGTKRQVKPEAVGKWIRQKKPGQKLVGVFVEPSISEIANVLRYVPLDTIQLHGNEKVSDVLKIKEAFSIGVWKVIHHGQEGLSTMGLFQGTVEGYVVDSKVVGAYGGTGVTFDWEAIPEYLNEAQKQQVPCLIAGGINHENARDVLKYKPQGIDLSSGTETEGKKDSGKIQALMKEVEQHATSISRS
jgi:phosphoribosylanthranilate isomerase